MKFYVSAPLLACAVWMQSAAQAALPLSDPKALPTLAPMLGQVTPAVVNISVLRAGRPMKLRARIGEPFAAVNIPGESVPQLAGARCARHLRAQRGGRGAPQTARSLAGTRPWLSRC